MKEAPIGSPLGGENTDAALTAGLNVTPSSRLRCIRDLLSATTDPSMRLGTAQSTKDVVTNQYHIPWNPGGSVSQALARLLTHPSLSQPLVQNEREDRYQTDARENVVRVRDDSLGIMPFKVTSQLHTRSRVAVVLTNTQEYTVEVESCYIKEAQLVQEAMLPVILQPGDEYGLLFSLDASTYCNITSSVPQENTSTNMTTSHPDTGRKSTTLHNQDLPIPFAPTSCTAVLLPLEIRWRCVELEPSRFQWAHYNIELHLTGLKPLEVVVSSDFVTPVTIDDAIPNRGEQLAFRGELCVTLRNHSCADMYLTLQQRTVRQRHPWGLEVTPTEQDERLRTHINVIHHDLQANTCPVQPHRNQRTVDSETVSQVLSVPNSRAAPQTIGLLTPGEAKSVHIRYASVQRGIQQLPDLLLDDSRTHMRFTVSPIYIVL